MPFCFGKFRQVTVTNNKMTMEDKIALKLAELYLEESELEAIKRDENKTNGECAVAHVKLKEVRHAIKILKDLQNDN